MNGSIMSETITYPLYHLSFNDSLSGIWTPKSPVAMEKGISCNALQEPDIARISVSPTVQQCFFALYPNISHYFEIEDYPYMDMTVYQPIFKGDERIVPSSVLTLAGHVHDAHITKEVMVLDTVDMKPVAQIRLFNTNKAVDLLYHPFNRQESALRYLSPKTVSWVILKS